jgi:hypothetical protein
MTAQQWADIKSNSVADGLVSAFATATVLGGPAFYLHRTSEYFRHRVGTSGKVSLVFIPAAFMFWMSSQRTVARARDHPDAYRRILEEKKTSSWLPTIKSSGLPPHHMLANFIHDRPFTFLSVGGGITVSSVFALEAFLHPGMKLSSRIMHTRVYAQGVTVLMLCGTMLFHEHMKHAGKYIPAHKIEKQPSNGNEKEGSELVGGQPQQRAGRWDLYLPLVYAPMLPLIRIGLKGRTSPRNVDRVFFTTLAAALAHAGYILFSDSSA